VPEVLALLKQTFTTPVLQPFSRKTGQNSSLRSVTATLQDDEDDFLRRAAALVAQGGSRPSLRAYDLVSTQFQKMVESTLGGELSVDEAIRRAAERIAGATDLPVV
jgi:hypothetical protein